MSYAIETAESMHQSSEAVEIQEVFLEAMKTVCFVYIENLRNLHETRKLQRDLGESVFLVLCDPPYNVPRQRYVQNGGQGVLDMNCDEAFRGFTEYV